MATFVLFAAVLFLSPTAFAQFTASSETNIVNGVASNWAGTYFIGNGINSDGLIVTNGGILTSATGLLGNGANDTNNFVLVTGAGSTWNNTGTLTVGASGKNNWLTIANGGVVVNYNGLVGSSGNKNAVVVTDSGSTWTNQGDLFVGFGSATNSLTIANGGVVIGNGNGLVGYTDGNPEHSRSNTVVVTGAGSTWNSAGTLLVGYAGQNNALTITNGGAVRNNKAYVGVFGSNTTVTVTGSGSTWNNQGFLNVGLGDGSTNAIVVGNGGAVTVGGNTSLGSSTGSKNNSITVTGSGSSFTGTGNLYVGENGPGSSLAIIRFGTVAAPNVYVGLHSSSTGNSITLNGGTLNAVSGGTGGLEVRRGTVTMIDGSTMNVDQLAVANGAASDFVFNGGTLNTAATTVNNGRTFIVASNGLSTAVLNLQGGAHSFANGLTVNAKGVLSGNGTVAGDVISAGTIAPGTSSPGTLTINGNLTLQPNSILAMKLGDTNSLDTIFVNGSVSLDGTLQVSIINPYDFFDNVTVGETFVLLQSNSPLGGTFTNVIGGHVWDAEYGAVFDVDYTDNALRLSFSQANIIPEPSACVLDLIGLVALLATRRRR